MNEAEKIFSAKNIIKVSVIVATYRREQSLFEALKSLVDQTYQNVEIVVVDDNADAFWNEKVNHIINKIRTITDGEICFIQNKENKGSAKTRNIGVENATGTYITFLDDDDVYYPEKVERQLDDMLACSSDYGITNLNLYNTKGSLIEKRDRSFLVNTDPDSLLVYHLKYHLTGTDTLMFKKDYFQKIGGFPPIDVGDEFYLMEHAIINAGKICYSNHCFVKAYVHEGEETGLSSGLGKISGENELYEKKKKYFNSLSKKDKSYIVMRHHAVLAFAYLRSKKYIPFIANAIKSMMASPVECMKLIGERR